MTEYDTAQFEATIKRPIQSSLALVDPSVFLQHDAQADALQVALIRWLATNPSKELYHTFQHTYDQATLSLHALGGQCLAQIQLLQAISAELPFDIFLAAVQKEAIEHDSAYYEDDGLEERDEDEEDYPEEDGSAPEPMTDELDVTYWTDKVVDLAGNTIFTLSPIDENALLDIKSFDQVEPVEESEEYEGDPASYGKIYRYHKTVGCFSTNV